MVFVSATGHMVTAGIYNIFHNPFFKLSFPHQISIAFHWIVSKNMAKLRDYLGDTMHLTSILMKCLWWQFGNLYWSLEQWGLTLGRLEAQILLRNY